MKTPDKIAAEASVEQIAELHASDEQFCPTCGQFDPDWKQRAAHASEQDDTKRLDWLFLTDEGWQWLADNLSYVRAHHRRPYFTNAIDAAMRKNEQV